MKRKLSSRSESRKGMSKTYKDAMSILNSRRRDTRPFREATANPAHPTTLRHMPSLNGKPSLKGNPSLLGMTQWLHQLGHSDHELDALNVIHVAGTKGKGSTCAFAESFLRAHGKRTGFPAKTGLYTSPHLISPEERIRINFEPLSRETFAKYFFEVFDALKRPSSEGDSSLAPRNLQLYALTAVHAFIREGVDVVILETHNGGEYDATNLFQRPVVTAISTLGMDHVKQLGPSLENIAWHKAGIFKSGAFAFSSNQEKAAAAVLESRALEKSVDLQFVNIDPTLPETSPQLKPGVQLRNASLALAVARRFIDRKGTGKPNKLTTGDILNALEHFDWPGRFQVIRKGKVNWYFDSAHNEMSVKVAAQWFAETATAEQRTSKNPARALIFGHISTERDGAEVLRALVTALKDSGTELQYAIFSTYKQRESSTAEDESRKLEQTMPSPGVQELYTTIWNTAYPNARAWHEPTIDQALQRLGLLTEGAELAQVLVTGSQHLVGGAIDLLNGNFRH